jgi:hypothetical protein
MIKCNLCPVQEVCSLYNKWLLDGEHLVQYMNSKKMNSEQHIFDKDTVPYYFGGCKLEQIVGD